MSLNKDKYDLLEDRGFRKHFKNALCYNRDIKKVFSIVAIEDHGVAWLRAAIESPNDTGTWQFYFNQPVNDDVRRELLAVFGE